MPGVDNLAVVVGKRRPRDWRDGRCEPAARAVRPRDSRARRARCAPQVRPAGPGAKPRDVRRPDRDGGDARRIDRPSEHLCLVGHGLARAHGPLRELRRSGRRRPWQGPGRHASPDAIGHRGSPPWLRRDRGARCGRRTRVGRPRGVRSRRHHPVRRRDHRGCRVSRRIGDHG